MAICTGSCGGGLLAEEFARLGCRVTGVDLSEPSLETARAHAEEEGLEIRYVRARAENLPFDEASFNTMLALARAGVAELTARQRAALGLA